jgi:ribosome-associated protein
LTKKVSKKVSKKVTKKVTKTTAKKVVRFALEKKALQVDLMDVRKITTVTDFFIVCSGNSDVHVKAIADSVVDNCKKDGMEVYNVEGYESRRWILIDLIEIVVHIFKPDVRSYYQLERLWGDAPTDKFGYEE